MFNPDRRRFSATLCAGLITLGLASVASAQSIRIGIASFGEHPQLNAAVAGFKKALAAEGFVEGKSVSYSSSHTNFDASLVPQMIAKLRAEQPKLILTVTTPVSQIAKKSLAGSGIPLVFAAVTDPVAAKLTPSWEQGDSGMTGASDLQDMSAILAFARKLVPQGKTFGIPYNPGEANDVAMVEKFKAAAPAAGFTVVSVGIDNVNDIQQRVASFKGKADVIYNPASNLLQPAVSAVATAARQIGLPLINAGEEAVRTGEAVASVAVGYEQVGMNAGRLAAKVLRGVDIKTLGPTRPGASDHVTVISRKALAAYKFSLPKELEACNCFVD